MRAAVEKVVCEACRRRGEEEPCSYAESRGQGLPSKETEQILELFHFLRSEPENQALDSLRIIRSHSDIETVLSIVQAGRSQERGLRGRGWPPISTRHLGLEYELIARNPVAFPPLQPLESSIIKAVLSTGLLSATNGEVNEGPFGASASTPSDPEASPFSAHHFTNTKSPISTLRPCDERLEGLDMSFWSSVPISDDIAAKIISLYLETDHPLLGTFDPDLFVDDLVNCRLRYCSPLLVSALMYRGCQMCTGSASDPAAKEYTPQFREEAEKRWTDEKDTDTLLNLPGTQLLGLAYLGDGEDHYVLAYVSEANAMATRMGLFGVNPTVAAGKAREITPDLQNATSYAAWGTFNWIVPASHTQKILPYFQYPGMRGIRAAMIVTSQFESLCSPRIWAIPFRSYAGFGEIIHEVTLRYYRDQPHPRARLSDHVSLAFAEYKYRELIALGGDSAAIHDALRTESASCSHLSYLVPCGHSRYFAPIHIVYRKNYASSTYTMLWHTALIHVANALLDDTKDSAWRFYLLFCIQCYGSLRHSYRFAEAIGRSLLSMTLQKGDLSASDARKLMQQFEESWLINPSEDIRATFMADLNLAMTDPGEASVESLAQRFEDIALFREFTTQEDSGEDESMDSDENAAWESL
ncbi:hypothetical protein MRS44_018877 [Fusarium solani]|uniref:uncharacterized protein n=1 Tax=Fusarium solani TaxID=169388 RepID=UPI0032C458F6|nr:hypothetical protein MRS44_018877 [Fusarium solani]